MLRRQGSAALAQQHKLTPRQVAPSTSEPLSLPRCTKPAESTGKALPQTEKT